MYFKEYSKSTLIFNIYSMDKWTINYIRQWWDGTVFQMSFDSQEEAVKEFRKMEDSWKLKPQKIYKVI